MARFGTSRAKATHQNKPLFTALQRCFIQKIERVRSFWGTAAVLSALAALSAPATIACMPAFAQTSGSTADVIYIHANVYTGVPAKTEPRSIERAEAIAVRGERILAVGTSAEIEKLKGPQTQVIDLSGHFVMPGFNDAHLHLADAGLQKLRVDLTGVKSLKEFSERVLVKVKKAGPDEWVLGGGWDETLWTGKTLPGRRDLDGISAGHPVFLDRVDGHLAVANTRALQLAGVTSASRDPQGGLIDKDENGQPTGILRDTAQQAVRAVIPPPTHEMRRQGIEVALADLAAH